MQLYSVSIICFLNNRSFTEAVGDKDAVLNHLKEYSYSTATRGERHLHAARFNGLAVYKLVRHRGDTHTHLVYELVEPQQPGAAQKGRIQKYN
jgi:hypothetical protein